MKAPHIDTRAVGVPALAAGTTSTYTTGAAISVVIRGKAAAFAAKTNQATPTTDYATSAAFVAVAINKGSVYVFGCILDGTVKVCQGSIEDMDETGAFKVYPKFPPIPRLMCPFGYIVVKNGPTGSAWTFGSSNWNATGITATATDVATLPDRPQG